MLMLVRITFKMDLTYDYFKISVHNKINPHLKILIQYFTALVAILRILQRQNQVKKTFLFLEPLSLGQF